MDIRKREVNFGPYEMFKEVYKDWISRFNVIYCIKKEIRNQRS